MPLLAIAQYNKYAQPTTTNHRYDSLQSSHTFDY